MTDYAVRQFYSVSIRMKFTLSIIALSLMLLTGCSGCNTADNEDPINTGSPIVKGNGSSTLPTKTGSKVGIPPFSINSEPQPKKAIPIPDAPPEALHEPVVHLSDGHDKTCLVKVGDHMPKVSLPDLNGDEQTLVDLYGEKLTVVVFWNSTNVYGAEQFMRLNVDTVDRFSGFGVSTVAINVGDEQADVKTIASWAESKVPCLLDENGDALKTVATSKLPRTYVLDAEGKIVWFDIEYSLSTARELRNALFYFLRKNDGGGEGVSMTEVLDPSKMVQTDG